MESDKEPPTPQPQKVDFLDQIRSLNLPESSFDAMMERRPQERKKFWKIASDYEVWFKSAEKPANLTNHNDESVRSFLKHCSTKYRPSTLWTMSNYAKDYVTFKYGVDRKSFILTKDFLKRKSVGYEPKKSKILTFQEYEQFWSNADEGKTKKGLLRKVLSLCGFYAADRSIETAYLLRKDVEVNTEKREVKITTKKRKGNQQLCAHIIPSTNLFDSASIFTEYLGKMAETVKLEPEDRFFKQIDEKTGHFKNQNVGEKYLTVVIQYIAQFTGKADPQLFTSQGNRAACATAMIESGAPMKHVMMHGNWQSENVANGYLRKTDTFMRSCAEFASGGKKSVTIEEPPAKRTKSEAPTFNFTGCEVKVVYNSGIDKPE